MTIPGAFTLPRLERVISGPGALDSLPAEMDRYGCRRAVVVTGATLGASALIARVAGLLGARCAAVFTGSRQHVPSSTVDALLRSMRDARADALVSVGGGSPIDTAKGAVHAIVNNPDIRLKPDSTYVSRQATEAERREGDDPVSRGDSRVGATWAGADVPVHIAVPTTLSAGEFTDVAGITDEQTRIKHALFDARLAPRTVIADPVVTIDTPTWLWAASGIRALDHAIETLYASRRHPISEPLAERAIGMLLEHLPASCGDRDGSVIHRGHCQMAAWLAVFGITNAGFGLSHVLGHQIGPRWNVPHGFTSAIMLPHAMRVMAAAVPSRFDAIARAFGVAFDAGNPQPAALACADRTALFIERLSLPSRLRDVGVPQEGLRNVAGVVAALMARGDATVGTSVSAAELEQILNAGY